MRVLLDTQVLIWWDAGRKLSSAASTAIAEADEVYVRSASAWEVAIKTALGKISSKRSITAATAESGFRELAIGCGHAEQVRRLPAYHRDPFDRILIAQAQVEDLVIVSRDRAFTAYDVAVMLA